MWSYLRRYISSDGEWTNKRIINHFAIVNSAFRTAEEVYKNSRQTILHSMYIYNTRGYNMKCIWMEQVQMAVYYYKNCDTEEKRKITSSSFPWQGVHIIYMYNNIPRTDVNRHKLLDATRHGVSVYNIILYLCIFNIPILCPACRYRYTA